MSHELIEIWDFTGHQIGLVPPFREVSDGNGQELGRIRVLTRPAYKSDFEPRQEGQPEPPDMIDIEILRCEEHGDCVYRVLDGEQFVSRLKGFLRPVPLPWGR